MEPISAAITAGLGAIGSVANMIAGNRQQKKNMRDINALGVYQENPYASRELAFAQNLYNGRMGGASIQEQNILANQANAMASVQNNATDASQALAIAAGLQGQTNNSFANLAAQEAMDKMNRAGLLTGAYRTMINEGDKVWQDKVRQLQQKIGVRAVGTQNTSNAINGMVGSIGFAGNAGLFDNLFKGGGGAMGNMMGGARSIIG